MKLSAEEFCKINRKARNRNSRWFLLFFMAGAALLGLIMGLTWPWDIFNLQPWTWQWFLWHLPPAAYFISAVALWEKAQDNVLRFYRNVFQAVGILEGGKT
jgi:hypothetical protein